jgi:hypothetical protein
MKTILRKSAIAASLIIALAAASFQSHAENGSLDNEITSNVSVAIKVKNAVGAAFVIKNEKGTVVYEGTVKNNKTFYIPGRKLGAGTFYIQVANAATHTFQVQ